MNTTTTDSTHPLLRNRLAVSRSEIATLLGVSETLAFKLLKDGGIKGVAAGRRRLVPVKALLEWMESGGNDLSHLKANSPSPVATPVSSAAAT